MIIIQGSALRTNQEGCRGHIKLLCSRSFNQELCVHLRPFSHPIPSKVLDKFTRLYTIKMHFVGQIKLNCNDYDAMTMNF
jgi:hypothetical protein